MEEVRKRRSIIGMAMKYLVPLVITVGLCWVMFTKIDFGDMMLIIRTQCNFWWIGLMLFISVWAQVFRAFRWRIQLRAIGVDAPISILILSIFGTYSVNLVFPRLGELWRCTYVAHRQKANFSSVFGSMLADRMADAITVTILTILTVALVYAQASGSEELKVLNGIRDGLISLLRSPWLWAALASAIAIVWWVLARKVPETDGQNGLANKLNACNRRLQTFASDLWHGFAVVAKMKGKGRFLLFTTGIWGCFFLQMLVSFFAFPFTESVFAQYGIVAVLFTFVISSIAMGLPSQGGIGPYQLSCMLALGCYGVPDKLSLTFGNLVLGTTTLLLIIQGIFTFCCIMLDKRKNKDKFIQKS